MLKLKGSEPLFVGGTRYCFIHPDHADRCVKVLRPDRTGAARKARLRNWKRFLPASSFDDQLKEIKAYRVLQRRNDPELWQHVPEYFGTADTDMGLGIVTRLFRNADGSYRVLVVDGIGNSEWIPVSTWSRFFARRKIARKIAKFRYRTRILLPPQQAVEDPTCNS
jgi:hypothetical protein